MAFCDLDQILHISFIGDQLIGRSIFPYSVERRSEGYLNIIGWAIQAINGILIIGRAHCSHFVRSESVHSGFREEHDALRLASVWVASLTAEISLATRVIDR